MKTWHFFDKVYRIWLVVVEGSSEDFREFLKDATYTEPFEDGNAGALIYLCATNTTNGNRCYVLWMNDWQTGCLIHELAHLTIMVFNEKDVLLSHDNCESFAYYIEYWYNEITRVHRRLPDGRSSKEAKKVK